MEEKILFTIKTKMDKEDYRKFLYLATFKKSPIIIPIILLIAAIGAGIIAFENGNFNIIDFLIAWVFMTLLVFGTICFKVEHKNKKRIETDKIGTFGTYQTISFCDDYVIVINNANMASLIRKKDIEDEYKTEIIRFLKEKLGKSFRTI